MLDERREAVARLNNREIHDRDAHKSERLGSPNFPLRYDFDEKLFAEQLKSDDLKPLDD